MEKLAVKKLFSNQIEGIVAPPSIRPSTAMEFTERHENAGPPSTVPNETELQTLKEKQKTESNLVNASPKATTSFYPSTIETLTNYGVSNTEIPTSSKLLPSVSNVLMATKSSPTSMLSIDLVCSKTQSLSDKFFILRFQRDMQKQYKVRLSKICSKYGLLS